MKFDSGRLKDLQMLEDKLKKSTNPFEKGDIQRAINAIKGQAENVRLSEAREQLLNARRAATNAKGEINIKKARDEADKLEEHIHNAIPYWHKAHGMIVSKLGGNYVKTSNSVELGDGSNNRRADNGK